LQLQKILYYIQGEFFKIFNKPAFAEDIEATQHGAFVPVAYYKFNKFIANKIREKYDDVEIKYNSQEIMIINKVLNEKSCFTAWELVTKNRNEAPWHKNYKPNKNVIIPKEDIKKYFSKSNNLKDAIISSRLIRASMKLLYKRIKLFKLKK
jgi:uncharacterized phage-associated protein